jgi:hypothetical protein
LTLIATLGMTACSDFLTIQPVGAVGEPELTNQAGIDMIITGMYAELYNTDSWYFESPLTNYQYGDVLGGQANKGSAFADQPTFTNLETYSITTDNSYLRGKWRACYDGVFRANNLMVMAGRIQDELSAVQGESKDYYTETIAQARFMRGFWHFEAIKVFGAAIPYVTDEDVAANVNPQVSNVDESGNYIYIWDRAAEDLQYAYDNLPNTWSVNQGYANKWAAAAFLAKLRLYQSSPYNGTNATSNHWAEVKSLLETIIASGVDSKGQKYTLADTYETLYTAGISDWTGESVFDIQTVISGTQTNTNALNGGPHNGMSGALGVGGWGFYQPSYEMVNSFIVDDNGLPKLDKSYQNQEVLTTADANNIPHTDLTVYTDPRLDVAVGRFQTPFLDYAVPMTIDGWVREVSNGGLYLNKKLIPKKADRGSLSVATSATSTAKNFHLIRYADILLWYAEALIETGDPQGAGRYINEIRARAAKGYVKAADPATMEETTSPYVLDDKVNNQTLPNAAGNYRVGLYPDSQFATKESALQALRFERKLEMSLEGHRWFDLARWGIAYDELTNYLAFEKQYLSKYNASVYNEKWVTLPIPYDEIILMEGLLVQNENWK